MEKVQKPFGQWASPISVADTAGQLRLFDVGWAGDGETVVWAEGRGSRGVLLARKGANAPRELSGEVNVRGGVGYGGGEFAVSGSSAFFAGGDGRIYRAELGYGAPRAITPAYGRVAAPAVSPDGRWVVFVHTDGKTDVLAAVDAEGRQWPWKIVVGADFYMQPAWSPDGARLCWVSWDQPNMPWDSTVLETAAVEYDGRGFRLGPVEVWSGGDDVAIQQPTFSPDGRHLAFTSDAGGFSNLWLRDLSTHDMRRLSTEDADIAGPAWVQGLRHFAWTPDGQAIVATRNVRGVVSLVRYGIGGGTDEIAEAAAYAATAQPAVSARGHIAFLGSSSVVPPRVVVVEQGVGPRVIQRSSNERVSPEELARMAPVSWVQRIGSEEVEVFGNYYAPTSARFAGIGRPPAIVRIHGGPTSQRIATYDAQCQFFATRGFAVLDVNYRGSTGYGREYMELLRGQWGVLDVEDAVGAAKFLVSSDLADPDKLVIMGGSAGGYTVLQALTDHPGAFAAGVCLYGIANLFTLAASTHKFEASYNDILFGALPEAAPVYRARSPIFKADRITDPVAIYHGREDTAVPPDQAEAIVAVLRERGVPHYFHMYDDEGHGFRRPENLEQFYESLMEFLTKHVIYG